MRAVKMIQLPKTKPPIHGKKTKASDINPPSVGAKICCIIFFFVVGFVLFQALWNHPPPFLAMYTKSGLPDDNFWQDHGNKTVFRAFGF